MASGVFEDVLLGIFGRVLKSYLVVLNQYIDT